MEHLECEKTWFYINFYWFLLIFIDFHWFFIDFHWFPIEIGLQARPHNPKSLKTLQKPSEMNQKTTNLCKKLCLRHANHQKLHNCYEKFNPERIVPWFLLKFFNFSCFFIIFHVFSCFCYYRWKNAKYFLVRPAVGQGSGCQHRKNIFLSKKISFRPETCPILTKFQVSKKKFGCRYTRGV